MATYTSQEVQNGELRYRIEMRQTAFGDWQQRHIWLARPHGNPGADAWIKSTRSFDPAAKGFTLVEEVA